MRRSLLYFLILLFSLFQTSSLCCKESKQETALKGYTEKIEQINQSLSSTSDTLTPQEYEILRGEIVKTISGLNALQKEIVELIQHSTPQEKAALEQTLSRLDEINVVANNILKTLDNRKIQSNLLGYIKFEMPLYKASNLKKASEEGFEATKNLSSRMYQSLMNIGKNLFSLIFLIVVVCYIPFARVLRKKFATSDEKISYLNKIKTFMIYAITGSLIPALLLGLFFYMVYLSDSLLFAHDEVLFFYLAIAFVWVGIHTTSLFMNPKDFKWVLIHIDKPAAEQRSRRIALFLLFLAIRLFLNQIHNPPEFTQYLKLAAQILLSTQALFIINVTHFRKSIKLLLTTFAVACPILIFVGFAPLANLLLVGTLYTLLVYLSYKGLSYTFKSLLVYAFKDSNSIFTDESNSLRTSDLSVYWTHTLFNVVLLLVSCYLVLLAWGFDQVYLNTFVSQILFGFRVGAYTISLIDIFLSIVIFLSLFLLTKYAQNLLKKHVFPYTNFDAGLRHALKATTGYIGFTFAVVLSLKTLGLNFSSLLYILGGLSVGIGLGLQPIVTNFISGLVLLIERPIKIGDVIELGNETGTVKKINVRTTEIESFEKCSVLYPNSQIMNVMIKNWTKNDRVKRIEIHIGVAYDSDTKLVESILLECAKKESTVLATPAPYVIFSEFADSSINFTLRCYLKNLDTAFPTGNALKHSILTSLKDHGIKVPFPQTDIHFDKSFVHAFTKSDT